MPTKFTLRRTAVLTLSAAAAGIAAAALPSTAAASTSQITIMQDAGLTDPTSATTQNNTFAALRQLGATTARIIVPWSLIAPNASSHKKPAGDSSSPTYYPAASWAPYDAAVRLGQQYGITPDFTVSGGAPQWAEASKLPGVTVYNRFFGYKPNAAEYGRFMTAIATRYSGAYTPPGQSSPLPAVHFWAIYNEPNFGEDLGPQALHGSKIPYAPMLYRKILNAGWKALQTTGHGHDTILVGGYAARGIQGGKYPGNYSQTKPLLFIRDLYCVDKNYRQLRGKLAKQTRCPTSKSGVRKFRSQNPALFSATGVADHPYPVAGTPLNDGKGDRDFATFPDLGNLARTMDRVTSHYGSHKKFPIYNDEYGYITRPPANRAPSGPLYLRPEKAAVYMNWAEYLSYKNPRVKSYMQYLMRDPSRQTSGVYGGFASGLEFPNGSKKATYFSFNLPVWMPKTSFSHKKSVEVWGDARPGNFAHKIGPQSVVVRLQKNGKGAFVTLSTVPIKKANGYFDIKMKFPSSGNVQLAYTYPPAASDPLLPMGIGGTTIASRSFAIKVH
jgi:hypothetical protein